MAERIAEFIVRLDGDNSALVSALGKLKGVVSTTVSDLERTTNSVELFKTTQQRVKDTGAEFLKLTERAASFRQQIAQIEGAGGNVGKELTDALKETEKQIAKTSREYDRQATSLAKLEVSLTKAGVDTKNLAREEERLAVATKAATQAQAEQQARAALGIKSTKDTADAIAKLNAAYDTLRKSGSSSVTDVSNAQAALIQKTRDLRNEQGGLQSSFLSLRAGVLGTAAALAAVVAGTNAAIEAARAFEVGTGRLGTVSNASQAEIKALGEGVRQLSGALGFDLQEGLNAAYDLLRQGVPVGNILDVLASADQAAKAGVTELGTAAKLAGVLIRGFGVDVKDVQGALDAAFVAAKNGGATFEELANGLGPIAPIAKSLKIPLNEVLVAVQAMVQAGLDAPSAIGQLGQIMTRLGDRDTIKRLKELGVESNGLIGTLQQLADRRIGIDEVIELGVASKKSANGVAALTADSEKLAKGLEDVANAQGAIAKADDEFVGKTQAEAFDKLTKSASALVVSFGQLVAPSTAVLDSITQLIRAVDQGAQQLRDFGAQGLGVGGVLAAMVGPFSGVITSINLVAQAFGVLNANQSTTREELAATQAAAVQANAALAASLGGIATAIEGQIAAADKKIKDLRTALEPLGPQLAATAKQIQDAANNATAAITAEAQGRLAALNGLAQSERANALEAVRIARESATERLKILKETTAQVLAAANAEFGARRAAAKGSAEEIAKIDLQAAANKQATLQGLVQKYQAYLNELVGQETAHLNKLKDLNNQRLALNTSIEDRIREIRRSGLTEYEQYQDKIRQIDENVSKARRALAEGDLKAAETFANKAIELTSGIAAKIEKDGAVVVSQLSAQETAVGKLKDAQGILNGVIDARVDAEKKGADATRGNVESATGQIAKLKEQLAGINTVVEDGLALKLTADTTKVFEEIDKLAAEAQGREVLVALKLKVEDAKKQLVEVKADLEAGLNVEANVKLDKVTAAVESIREARPELTVQTAQAQQSIGALRTAIADLGQPVTVEATVDSNVGQVQAAIDDLKKPTFSTHTITVTTVEANAAGGVVGDKVARMRRAFPAAREAVQGFARGGAVFRRPAWTKVPGAGNEDTVPAALQSGSFVVKKAASQHYGDGLMRALAGIRHFALGGIATALPLLQGRISDIVNSRVLASLGGGGSGRKIEGVDVGGLESKLVGIQEAARGLPRSRTGLDIGTWASALLQRITFMGADKVKILAAEIEKSYEGILAGIENARQFRVPSVVAEDLLGFLFLKMGGRAAQRGTDTVPAMLTPGEFVVKQPRVKQLGEGFMHAVNSMRFSRESLAAMLAGPAAPQRPRHYAHGGAVASAGGGASSSVPLPGGGGRAITVNLNASAQDLFSTENVRRFLLPVLKDLDRVKR